MGSGSSKVPLNLLKPSIIANKKTRKNYVLSPRLCVAIFRQTNGSCNEKDIKKLRDFIGRPMNMKFFGAAKCKISERELLKFMKDPQQKLSSNTELYLKSLLTHLDNSYRKPALISSIVMPKLELLYAQNKSLHRQERALYWKTLFKNCYHFVYSLIWFELSPKTLRKSPKLQSEQGLDRAHILSLFLAVELWKKIYGHQFVKLKDKTILKEVLSLDSNIYYTCKHTNRTLHVKYDNEIAEAIISKKSTKLSPGAKIRIKHICRVLPKFEKHSSNSIHDFCTKAKVILTQL